MDEIDARLIIIFVAGFSLGVLCMMIILDLVIFRASNVVRKNDE